MLVIPIGLALLFTAKWKTSGILWLIGATIFILSQVGHIPFNIIAGRYFNQTSLVNLSQQNQIHFNAIFLGLSAGIWEETARLAMFVWWAKKARSWKEGILLGLGHGGSESIIIGFFALYSLLQVLAVRNVDISKLVPAEQISATILKISEYWSMPWHLAIMGSIERLLTIPIQVAFSLLVLQALLKKNILWYFLTILLHAFIDASAIIMVAHSNIFLAEGLLACFSILCIGFILRMRTSDENKTGENEVIDKSGLLIDKTEKDETKENLEETIFL